MPFFGEDKRKKILEAEKKAAAERRKELEKIIARPSIAVPKGAKPSTIPQTYREFLRDVKKKSPGIYERACSIAEKLNLKPSKNDYAAMDENIKLAYLNATPTGVLSLAIVAFVFGILFSGLAFLAGGMSFGIIMFLLSMVAAYFIYDYPAYKARAVLAKMSSDTILAVLYMIIYMRSSPNLEGALKFSSENLSGPLAWDLKKLLWDIEIGSYRSADEALAAYIEKWKSRNTEFAEALNLLRGSAVDSSRREKLYTETMNVILNGTLEHTKHYVSGLRLPVMLIHAMGVLLPVMGLILFPIVMIFMSNAVKPISLFLMYDIALPIILWFTIDHILRGKPATFSQPDISLVKGVPPIGKYAIGEKLVPLFLPIFVLTLLIVGTGLYMLYAPGPEGVCSNAEAKANTSLIIISGLALGIYLFCKLDSSQKMKIRSDVEKIESEFSVALFQLGNQISSGAPIEVAVERSAENLKGMKISELFRMASQNMRKFGLTFEEALYDKTSGAIWYYPSRLIRSIMSAIVQSSKKGMTMASDAMVTVSQYLKGIHDVKEDVGSILGETTTSMRFLGTFLTPMVAGVTITMAVVILQIITVMSGQLQQLSQAGTNSELTGFQSSLTLPWASAGTVPISPGDFQLIVGLYMIETVILLSMFVNRIEYGDDAIGLRSTIASSILIALFIYVLTWFITYGMFGSPIRDLLTPSSLTSNLAGCV